MGMSRRSLHYILHDKLKFHSYKIIIVQQLTKKNYVQCREFCERMKTILTNAYAVIMMSDEAHFHLDGYVNKQNHWYWVLNRTLSTIILARKPARTTPKGHKSDSVVRSLPERKYWSFFEEEVNAIAVT